MPYVRDGSAALDLAIDKSGFITGVLKGAGEPLKTFTPPPAWQGSPVKAVYDTGYAALPGTGKADSSPPRPSTGPPSCRWVPSRAVSRG